MKNILCSFFVVLFVALLIALLIFIVQKIVKSIKKKRFGTLVNIVLIIPILLTIMFFSNYMYPFQREVQLEEIYRFDDAVILDKTLPWHSIYKAYGIGIDSRFDVIYASNIDIEEELDFDNYTYIISYGKPIEKLSYNIWDCKGTPILDLGTSALNGYAQYGVADEEPCVYVYRIKRMRIDFEGL